VEENAALPPFAGKPQAFRTSSGTAAVAASSDFFSLLVASGEFGSADLAFKVCGFLAVLVLD
jgi:hypothetical protein